MRVLARSFYDRDAPTVARELLNKILVCRADGITARIVEVEAYCGSEDPGSHAYRGLTKRNASMFARPGTLYVYFTYGMHWCANAVCGPGGQPHAVLLRAAVPLEGIEIMRSRRHGRSDRELLRGPARLAQAFALDGSRDGADLVRGVVRIADDDTAPPKRPWVTRRVGLAAGKGDRLRQRYCVPGEPLVSGPPGR